MASFFHSGPSFLTAVDWNNFQHRWSVAASLVQGVYTHEHDRLQKRQDTGQALAPPWWEFFDFSLVEVLVDKDESYFAAVFEYMMINSPHRSQPRYVIAFRGTINKLQNMIQDYNHNGRVMMNEHNDSNRFQMGLEKVFEIVGLVGHENVWLAGHSLGSALALAVGRQMAKQGHPLETYLFNPPFISLPIERLFKNANLKLFGRAVYSFVTAVTAAAAGNRNEAETHFTALETYLFNPPFPSPPIGLHEFELRLLNSLLTAALAATDTASAAGQANTFSELSTWVPYLFINPSDPICSEYVGYFKHRENMESIGAGILGWFATMHSKRSILFSAARERTYDPVDRIPSAHLILNLTPSNSFKKDHGIYQWWRPDLQFHYEHHQYNM